MSVPARRRQVAYSRERGLSALLFKVARSALSYQGRKPPRDAAVVERMRALSAQYPRYGYRRIRIFLGRDVAQAAEEERRCCSAATASAVRAEPSMVL